MVRCGLGLPFCIICILACTYARVDQSVWSAPRFSGWVGSFFTLFFLVDWGIWGLGFSSFALCDALQL